MAIRQRRFIVLEDAVQENGHVEETFWPIELVEGKRPGRLRTVELAYTVRVYWVSADSPGRLKTFARYLDKLGAGWEAIAPDASRAFGFRVWTDDEIHARLARCDYFVRPIQRGELVPRADTTSSARMREKRTRRIHPSC